MKKYLAGSLALMMAVSAVALPKMGKHVDYFWYKRTGADSYVANGQGPDPMVVCVGTAKICAKGFLQSQAAGSITDATVADDQRTKN